MNNGRKSVIERHGVFLTPDHEVMTTDGWKAASDDRFDRKEIRLPDGYWDKGSMPKDRQHDLAVSVRLRGEDIEDREDSQGRRCEKLRMQEVSGPEKRAKAPGAGYDGSEIWLSSSCGEGQGASVRSRNPLEMPLRLRRGVPKAKKAPTVGAIHQLRLRDAQRAGKDKTWNDRNLHLSHLGVNVGKVPESKEHSVQRLWWTWHFCLSEVDGLRELLGRHGGKDFAGTVHRPHKQRRQLRTRKLPLGNKEAAGKQSEEQQAEVYDILNCGQRQAFTVIGRDGLPLLVHNCWTHSTKDFCDQPHRPFITWPYQERGLRKITEVFGREDILLEKSRDMGASWCILVSFLHRWLFKTGQTLLVGSRKEDLVDKPGDPGSLFWRLDYMIDRLPPWMVPRHKRTALHLENIENESTIEGESTNENFARGKRPTAIMLDEFAFVPRAYEVAYAAHYATNCCIFNSTYCGASGSFFDHAQQMRAEDPSRVLRWHWTEHPLKSKGMCLKDGRASSPWYEKACKKAITKREIAQEIDIEPSAAGGLAFDSELLAKFLLEMPLDPLYIGELSFESELEPRWMQLKGGRLEVWCVLNNHGEPPLSRYVVGCDIASGGGERSSYSVAACYDVTTGEKVAQFSDNGMLPERFADYVVAICKWLGGAFLIWESNGPGGQFGQRVVKELRYAPVFSRVDEESIRRGKVHKPGYRTGPGSKRRLLGAYQQALFSRQIINRSAKALKECSEFVESENDWIHVKAKDAVDPSLKGDNHGDFCIADGLAWRYMQDLKPRTPRTKEPVSTPRSRGEPPAGSMGWRIKQRLASKVRNLYF